MGVDVVDVRRSQSRTSQCHVHASDRARMTIGRCRDVMGIVGQAIADHLSINARHPEHGPIPRTPSPRCLPLHPSRSRLGLCQRATRRLGIIVSFGQGTHSHESGQAQTIDSRFGPTRNHQIRVA